MPATPTPLESSSTAPQASDVMVMPRGDGSEPVIDGKSCLIAVGLCVGFLVIAVVIWGAVTGGGGSSEPDQRELDDAGQFACDDFAAHLAEGDIVSRRADAVAEVNRWASRSDVEAITDAARGLASAINTGADWEQRADLFAQTCFDHGWDG